MESELQVQFKRIVEQIFSNWSALQLAVEHSMGGPYSRQIALQTIDHICNYCFSENDIEADDICDELEDILDEEFNTICEDESPKQVSQVIWRFWQIVKMRNVEQLQAECSSLPPVKGWLTQPVAGSQNVSAVVQDKSSMISDDESKETNQGNSMDVDSEWTVVKGRRKK